LEEDPDGILVLSHDEEAMKIYFEVKIIMQ